jgi:hypothetical protein
VSVNTTRELEARSSSAGTEVSGSEPPGLAAGRRQATARLALDLWWIGRCSAAVKRRAGHGAQAGGFMGQLPVSWVHLPSCSLPKPGRSTPCTGQGLTGEDRLPDPRTGGCQVAGGAMAGLVTGPLYL